MALETGAFLHRRPAGGPGRGCCFTVDFERNMKSEIYVKKKLWKRSNLSVGAPLGNLKEGSFTGDFERL